VLAGVFLATLFAFILLRSRLTRVDLIAYSLVLGGGLSNLIDRLVNEGRVIDFLMIRIGWLSTAIFNLADVAILSGFVLLVVRAWQEGRKEAG
jgi:signal peptidase II